MPDIRSLSSAVGFVLIFGSVISGAGSTEQLPEERLLWPAGIPDNPIVYPDGERVRSPSARVGSPSGSNRVFSQVSTPTYAIHRPDNDLGVGLVILPGGGGAIRLKPHGVTSLVLKYRTNKRNEDGSWVFPNEVALPATLSDVREAFRILRQDDPSRKVGVSGFSAGGYLAANLLFVGSDSHQPDFAGLFYPAFSDEMLDADLGSRTLPPIYTMIASDDPRYRLNVSPGCTRT